MASPIEDGRYERCAHCSSHRLIKSGKSHFADGPGQRYECQGCHKLTTEPLQQPQLMKLEDVPL